jgi:hypothetical protein
MTIYIYIYSSLISSTITFTFAFLTSIHLLYVLPKAAQATNMHQEQSKSHCLVADVDLCPDSTTAVGNQRRTDPRDPVNSMRVHYQTSTLLLLINHLKCPS